MAIFECLMCHCFNEARQQDLPDWIPQDQREQAFAFIFRAPLVCQGCQIPVVFRHWELQPIGPTRDVKTVTDEKRKNL